MKDSDEMEGTFETDDREEAIEYALGNNFWLPLQRVELGGWHGVIISPASLHWNDLLVSTVRLDWGGPHEPILAPEPFEVVPRDRAAIESAVDRALQKRRSELVECPECGELRCPGYMMDNCCHACASANHGVLF